MISLQALTKSFGPIVAVDDVSLDVAPGEICVFLGPSGCGKTTTMKMINRLIAPTSGRVMLDGRDTATVDAVTLRRSIGYVIQQVGLFPNKTVAQNVCTVPALLGWDRARMQARAAEMLRLVNLDPAVFLSRYPRELSGGQAQRVGVARALAADPPVLLMDEPFGAIDPINREVIQDEFLRLQSRLKKTVVFVSHDIDEAVKLASRIAIFRDGRLIQHDTPDRVLSHPVDDFVAEFLGTDRTLKRLRLRRVADAMTDSPSVRPEQTLDCAARLMATHFLPALVVTGSQGEALGHVRREVAENGTGTVAAHAETLPALVQPGDDLRTAVSRMFTHDVTWLACVSADGRLCGVITQGGITHLLGAMRRGS